MNGPELRQQIFANGLRVLKRPADQQETPYVPICLSALMSDERVTFRLFVKITEGPEGHTGFIPYLEEGEVIESHWLDKLKNLGIEQLFFHSRDTEKAIAYLNNHLLVESGRAEPSFKELCILREHLGFSLRLAFKDPHLGQHAGMARASLTTLLQAMERAETPWKLLLDIMYRDYTLYNHSVNVAVLATAMGVFLKKPKKECLVLGIAGLFHDLGLIGISDQIISKKEKLTDEEWETLKKHPCLGYQCLKGKAEIPLSSLRLILEHHENAEGTGYPQGLELKRQHPLTRIIALLEAYDGLTIFRPYRPRHSPFAALKILQEERGKRGGLAFEPEMLKKFIGFLALAKEN
ncbi:MAG: HD domain-containing protein [Deltaproteobacteria bacterium]|nr:HD domain-containing protein [Deltaproteobacteria bacterium]